MTYKEAKNDCRYISGINFNGNLKLRNTENVRFMIWNIPAVVTCPFRTPSCEKFCYARKAERMYPSCMEARERNHEATLQADFAERMIFTIRAELQTKKFAGKKVVFRIHESGDFYSVEYFRKWCKIAEAFADYENIVFLAYTKSVAFYKSANIPNNLVIRSSLWADTCAKSIEITRAFDIPVYTALSARDMDEAEKNGMKFKKCRCEDCATCGMCWNRNIKTIITYIH